MHRRTPASALLAAVVAAGLVITACGAEAESGDADPPTSKSTQSPSEGSSNEPSPSASAETTKTKPEGVTIELTVRGNSIKPPAKVVRVKRGKPVVFLIDSDRAGALHVHSSPEQTPDFKKGKSSISVTLDMPGVVEVEEHEADTLVAQLEVR